MASTMVHVIAIIVVGVLALSAMNVDAYKIVVDAHTEECFFDTLTKGAKCSLTFQVAEGGFLDVDMVVKGPNGKEIVSANRETEGKYTFAADMDGTYTYCFSNKMSTVTPKVVFFNMEIGLDSKNAPSIDSDEKNHQELRSQINTLSSGLYAIKHEQEYVEVRERTHREINNNTNSNVVWWSFFEMAVLVTMTFGQIYYLKRFFEVRAIA